MAKRKMSQKEIDKKVEEELVPHIGENVTVEFEEYGKKESNSGKLKYLKRYRDDIPGTYNGLEIGNQGYPLSSVGRILKNGRTIYENPDIEYSESVQNDDARRNRIRGIYGKLDQAEFNKKYPGLEKHVRLVLPIISLIAAGFFITTGMTGNVIGNLNQTTNNWVGICFAILGICGLYIWNKEKKK